MIKKKSTIVKNKKTIIIFCIILFLLQFEFIGEGIFSVYRTLIFPTLILGILYSKIKFFKEDTSLILGTIVFFIAELLSSIAYNDFYSIIPILGQLMVCLFTYIYFQKFTINKTILYILITYSIFHLIFFIKDYGNFGLGNRFKGYHWDPNYMCLYILISFWAKIYLINKYNLNLLLRNIIKLLIISDIIMILFSLSKGGILSLILSVFIFLFVQKKRKALIILLILPLIYSIAIIRSKTISWSTDLSLVDSMIYRFFTQSEETGDISTGRIEYINNYINMIKQGEGIVLGMPIEEFIKNYNKNAYPHNSILEILISGGLIPGIIYITCLSFGIKKVLKNCYDNKYIPFPIIITISSILVIMFLTFLGLKISWLFIGIIYAFSNKKNFNYQKILNA